MSKKHLIITIITGFLIILGYWAFNVSSKYTREIEPLTSNNTHANAENESANIDDLVITETKDGQKFWELYASTGKYDNNQSGATLKKVTGNFYKGHNVVLSFSAPVATYIEKNKEINLTGGAKAITDKNIVITSNTMKWTGDKNEINNQGNVRIERTKDIIITSDHAVFNTDFTKFAVIGHSKTTVYKNN